MAKKAKKIKAKRQPHFDGYAVLCDDAIIAFRPRAGWFYMNGKPYEAVHPATIICHGISDVALRWYVAPSRPSRRKGAK